MQWESCVKRDLERVGGEWRTTAKDRRSWRLLIENAVSEKRGEEGKDEDNLTVTMVYPTSDDRDSKRRTRIKHIFDISVKFVKNIYAKNYKCVFVDL